MTVSAVVYSRNEADLLKKCLPAIIGFDELLVCDMQSSDGTIGVAEALGARLISVPDARVIEEVRQLGLDAATSDWVMFIDADEILPAGFIECVRNMLSTAGADGTVAFRLRYTNVAFDRQLKYTLNGSAKYSLMRRDAAHFPIPGRAHVPPEFDGPAREAPLSTPPILHLNFRSVEQMTEKTMRYARDISTDVSILRPTVLIREILRSTIFGSTWKDGYAGTAVSTSAVFGRWYGALLAAERSGILDKDFPPSELRRLRTMSRIHAGLIGARQQLRRVRGRNQSMG